MARTTGRRCQAQKATPSKTITGTGVQCKCHPNSDHRNGNTQKQEDEEHEDERHPQPLKEFIHDYKPLLTRFLVLRPLQRWPLELSDVSAFGTN